jgi:hypothetical protein
VSSPSSALATEIADDKDKKMENIEDEDDVDEEEERVKGEEPHPMENKVFVWNNLPQPMETESEEDHQLQPQAQEQQEEQQKQQQQQQQQQQQKQTSPLQQVLLSQQQDDDSRDTSVRSKSPISEGSLVGIETAPGYGAVTSKVPSDSPDGVLPDVDSKAALTVKKVKFVMLNVVCRMQGLPYWKVPFQTYGRLEILIIHGESWIRGYATEIVNSKYNLICTYCA